MKTEFRLTALKAILHSLAGIIGFVLIQAAASLAFYIPIQAVACILNAVVRVALMFVLFSLYCRKVLKIDLADCRARKPVFPKVWAVWLPAAVLLPALVSLYFILFADGVFANNQIEAGATANTIVYAIFCTCFAAGISEELLFRGYIMRLLEVRFGKVAAVIAPSVIFGLLHIANMQSPKITDILLLFAAGTSVGIMFSLICFQSGSVFPGAVVHGVWNLVIIGQILNIDVSPGGDSIFTYTLQSKSVLLTGGAFGIEASLPAVTGYAAVIISALVLIRSAKSKELGN